MLTGSPLGQAQSDGNTDESRIQQGFAIAPVQLNLAGKNRALVGLGSYIVNAQADCNGCHTLSSAAEYKVPGNPYLLPPLNGPKPIVNPSVYLGGGNDFGPFPSPQPPNLEHLYTRNLTPDKTGLPEGGHTFEEFVTIMRTGHDYDHVHPTCTGTPNGQCLPPPFNGDVLQVMPWPTFQNMTDHDLRAIYEYLSAIPCVDTVIAGAPYLRNDCGH